MKPQYLCDPLGVAAWHCFKTSSKQSELIIFFHDSYVTIKFSQDATGFILHFLFVIRGTLAPNSILFPNRFVFLGNRVRCLLHYCFKLRQTYTTADAIIPCFNSFNAVADECLVWASGIVLQ